MRSSSPRPLGTGKVKRLCRKARDELRPCDRLGRIDPGSVAVPAYAAVVDDDPDQDRLTDVLRLSYAASTAWSSVR